MDSEVAEFIENDAMNRIYLRHAYQYAQSYSNHPTNQLGAVLTQPSVGVVGWGVNVFVGTNSDIEGGWELPEKNVIYKCACRGICTAGMILYCPQFTSDQGARAIIQSGIQAVVIHDTVCSLENNVGVQMVRDAGLLVKSWNGEIGNNVSVRINGDTLSP